MGSHLNKVSFSFRTGFILDNHHTVYWILTAQFIHEEMNLYILLFNEQKSFRHKYLFWGYVRIGRIKFNETEIE